MQNLINFKESRLLNYLKKRLYNNKSYPRKYFPDIDSSLEKLFFQLNKKQTFLSHSDLDQLFSIKNLIKDYPQIVIKIYENVIRMIIKRHCFNQEYHEDIFQEIVLSLLDKQFIYILNNYDEKLFFTPYFTKVVLNLCLKIQTEISKKKLYQSENIEEFTESVQNTNFDFVDKFQILEKILCELNNSRILLLFKFIHKLPVSKKAIEEAFPLISKWDLNKYYNRQKHSEQVDYAVILPLFNKYEDKNIKVDSLRRVLDLYINEVSKMLNLKFNTGLFSTKKTRNLICELYLKHELPVSLYSIFFGVFK